MKHVSLLRSRRRLVLLSSCGVALALAAAALGIPQTFSQPSQFILRAGKPAEEFFRDPANWAAGAAIPGESAEAVGKAASTASEPGMVFGVGAQAVQLHRDSAGELTEATIQYDAKALGMTPQTLRDALQTNIAAFAGAKPTLVSGQWRFVTPELVISLPHEPSPTLQVRLTRKDGVPAAKPPARSTP